MENHKGRETGKQWFMNSYRRSQVDIQIEDWNERFLSSSVRALGSIVFRTFFHSEALTLYIFSQLFKSKIIS